MAVVAASLLAYAVVSDVRLFDDGSNSTVSVGGLPVKSPKASHRYRKLSNETLFLTDQSGNPVISGDLKNVKQGDTGDCYFLASLLAVAHRSQDTIKARVHDNGDGTYSGTFYGLLRGQHGDFQATVNGDLPGGKKPTNNGVEELNGKTVAWAAILEKLWAVVNGNSYSAIEGIGHRREDHDIENGLYALTGKVATERKMSSLTFSQMKQDYDQGVLVIGTGTDLGPLTGNHAYAVLGVDGSDTVKLRDPQGGIEMMSFDEFTSSNADQYFTVPMPKS